MSTFLEIKNEVAALVIDLPPTVQSAIGKLVNDAVRSAERKYNFLYMGNSVTGVTTVGTGFVSGSFMPLFKEYQDKGPYVFNHTAKSRRLPVAITYDVDLAILSSFDFPGSPQFGYVAYDPLDLTANFFVSPPPDLNSDWDDGNYRIVVPYYAFSAPLVNDGDMNGLTLIGDDYIIYKATAEAFGRDWDYDSMALWLQRADEKLKEIIKADKTQRLGAVDALVPMWRGANQPQVRR